MTNKKFWKLYPHWKAKRISANHKPFLAGKRRVKGKAKGVGQILKNSRVIVQGY